jgi:hypothetical protein
MKRLHSTHGAFEVRRCEHHHLRCPLRHDGASDPQRVDCRPQCLRIRSRETALEWLRSIVRRPHDMMTLRSFVGHACRNVFRLQDHDVITLLATMIVRRQLCVLTSPSMARPVRVRVELPRSRPAADITPARHRSPVTKRPALRLMEGTELVDDFDAVRHAATLVEAARRGLPFCEVCQLRR